MWKSNPSITGTNNIPLGRRRRGSSSEDGNRPLDADEAQYNSEDLVDSSIRSSYKRTSEDLADDSEISSGTQQLDAAEERRRKRRSRWGSEDSKVNIPGLPTAITASMTKEQLDTYLRK
jgi:splicing factor 1